MHVANTLAATAADDGEEWEQIQKMGNSRVISSNTTQPAYKCASLINASCQICTDGKKSALNTWRL